MTARTYLEKLVTLMQLQETGAEAFNLVSYIRETLPTTDKEGFIETFQVLEIAIKYWDSYGAWEDELQPLITICHALMIFCDHGLVTPEIVNTIQRKSDARVRGGHEPWPDPDENAYECWCDKYAEHLA